MLFLLAISSETLELLNEIMEIEDFQKLRLVRETALALQIGH